MTDLEQLQKDTEDLQSRWNNQPSPGFFSAYTAIGELLAILVRLTKILITFKLKSL